MKGGAGSDLSAMIVQEYFLSIYLIGQHEISIFPDFVKAIHHYPFISASAVRSDCGAPLLVTEIIHVSKPGVY